MDFIDEVLQTPSKDLNYYKILNCSEFSSTEQICTEYKIKARQFHPDKNLENPEATTEFMKLQIAKDVLTNSESRKDYDTWLNSGIKISYEKWKSMRGSMKMSMHWGVPKKQPMLKHNQHEDRDLPSTSSGEDFSEILRKFRNHEI